MKNLQRCYRVVTHTVPNMLKGHFYDTVFCFLRVRNVKITMTLLNRLKDEKVVCSIVERLQSYLENRGTSGEICRIYLRRIEHLYYKVSFVCFCSK